jgi:uncharacterized protein YggE
MNRSSAVKSSRFITLFFSAILAPGFLAAQERPSKPFIAVVGNGKVSARPDMAQIQVGVVTEAKAMKQNNDAMARLLATLESRGVSKKDVQTTNFNVMPQYRQGPHGEHQPEIVGYQVSNQVTVKVRKLNLLGPVLDELIQEGANQVHGISFTVAEPDPLLDEARRKAVADARRKAELYAAAASVTLGPVISIEEEIPHYPRPLAMGGVMAKSANSVPISEGEQDFAVSIHITYGLTARGTAYK